MDSSMEILVVGATGTVGKHVVRDLGTRDVRVRVATRYPEAVGSLPRNAAAVELDLERPETFDRAMKGVTRAFLMMPTGETQRYERTAALIKHLQASGARHVVNLTGFGTELLENSPIRRAELTLERSGMTYTHVRPTYFMQNFCRGELLTGIVERNEIAVAAGEARFSFVDARDIAALAAEALVSPGHENRAYGITGGAAISYAEAAATIAKVTGRALRYRSLEEAEAKATWIASGLSDDAIEQRLGFLAMARKGFFSATTQHVDHVLKRPPVSFEQFAIDHRSVWTGADAR